MAVVADVALAGAFTVLLLLITSSSLDAVPRPLALLALYAAPGVVGAIGVHGRRRSLLLAAGVTLVPGSVLSFTGVTLIFVLPVALFWAAGVTMGPPDPRPGRTTELAELIVVVALVLGAGLALFGLTWSGCRDTGSICGSGLLSVQGVVLELALLTLAVRFAASRTDRLRKASPEPGQPVGSA